MGAMPPGSGISLPPQCQLLPPSSHASSHCVSTWTSGKVRATLTRMTSALSLLIDPQSPDSQVGSHPEVPGGCRFGGMQSPQHTPPLPRLALLPVLLPPVGEDQSKGPWPGSMRVQWACTGLCVSWPSSVCHLVGPTSSHFTEGNLST